jgi:PKD repeat protein
MKLVYSFFLGLVFIITSAFSWEEELDYSFIKSDVQIIQMSLSEDGNFIVAKDLSGSLKKYSAETGEVIWEKIPESNPPENFSYDGFFLSSDALSYIMVYKQSDYYWEVILRIRDIDSDELIKEYTFNEYYPDSYTYVTASSLVNANYFTKSSSLFINDQLSLIINNGSIRDPRSGSGHSGLTSFQKFISDSTVGCSSSIYALDWSFSPDQTKLIFNGKHDTHGRQGDKYGQYYYWTYKYHKLCYNNTGNNICTTLHDLDMHDQVCSNFIDDNIAYVFINQSKLQKYDFSNAEPQLVSTKNIYDLPAFYSIKSLNNGFIIIEGKNKLFLFDPEYGSIVSEMDIPDKVRLISSIIVSPDEKYFYATNISIGIIRLENQFAQKSLKAMFSYSHQFTFVGEEVKFFDYSTGQPEEYLWDFGDGNTSTEKNPVHIYEQSGIYTVKLKVKNGNSTDEMIKSKIITVRSLLKADFEFEVISDFYPVEIKFKNTSLGDIDHVRWHLLDTNKYSIDEKQISYEDNFNYNFQFDGTYPVRLTVYSFPFVDEIVKNIIISGKVSLDNKNIIFEQVFDTSIYKNTSIIESFEANNGDLFLHNSSKKQKYSGLYGNHNLQIRNSDFRVILDSLHQNKQSHLIRRSFDNYLFTSYDDDNYVIHDIKSNSIDVEMKYHKRNYYEYYEDTKIQNGSIVSLTRLLRSNSGASIVKFAEDTTFEVSYLSDIPMKSASFYSFHESCIEFAEINSKYFYNFYEDYTATTQTGPSSYFTERDTVYSTNLNIEGSLKLSEIISFDDSIIATSVDGYVYCFDSDGNLLWDTYLGNNQLNDCLIYGNKIVAVGSINEQPGFYILDKDGLLLDSLIMRGRIGSFNHISLCPDGNYILSGYRMMNEDIFTGYLCKINLSDIAGKIEDHNIITFHQISGNPSLGNSTIEFIIEKDSKIQIDIFDIDGKFVKQIAKESLIAGRHKVSFSTEEMIGIFFYRISAGNDVKYGKFMVMN